MEENWISQIVISKGRWPENYFVYGQFEYTNFCGYGHAMPMGF